MKLFGCRKVHGRPDSRTACSERMWYGRDRAGTHERASFRTSLQHGAYHGTAGVSGRSGDQDHRGRSRVLLIRSFLSAQRGGEVACKPLDASRTLLDMGRVEFRERQPGDGGRPKKDLECRHCLLVRHALVSAGVLRQRGVREVDDVDVEVDKDPVTSLEKEM
jgi:hypothetical protein